MACPLCNNETFSDSWFGSTKFDEQIFTYIECSNCESLYAEPMPDEKTLKKMYGREYFKNEGEEFVLPHDPDDRFVKPLEWLAKNPRGKLLDYGCGAGELLEKAKELGWNCKGLEFDEKVAKNVEERLNIKIVNNFQELGENFQADVLHLGDVVEHLTDLNNQMPEILRLLKPGGVLLVQGPLEANANFFTLLLKYSRKLRGKPISNMPPYHVLLATVKGQRIFFNRFGLNEREFSVTEAAHPAPDKLSISDLSNFQKTGLFTARRFSQVLSAVISKNWGNRFFYVGVKESENRND